MLQSQRQPHDERPHLTVVAPSSAPEAARDRYGLALAAVLAVAVVLRAGLVLGSDFPLNDGGLFMRMTLDLQSAGYALPETTTYNGSGIPFTYPPLGFYLAAALDDLTPLGIFEVFRVLPLAGSIAALVAFLLLARAMLPTRMHVLIAVVAFSGQAATFQWMIMGGGITRAVGFTFALLAVAQSHRLYQQPGTARALGVGALAGAALLSHLEMGLIAAYSAGLFFVAYGRNRAGARATVAAAATASALVAPWLAVSVARHGLTPFLAAAQTGSSGPFQPVLLLLQFELTLEPQFPLLAALSLLGTGLMLARRQFLLPLWLLVTAIFDSRALPTSASFVLALLIAYAVVDVIVPLLKRADSVTAAPRWLLPGAACVATLLVILSALLTTPRLMTGMTGDERSAMAWVTGNTPPSSRFAILSDDGWAIDRTSEWFPMLTGRVSVATVQGKEWLAGEFDEARAEHSELQDCADRGPACLDEWADRTGNDFDYVYITKISPRTSDREEEECCIALRALLHADEGYRQVFDGPGAVIFERR